MRKLSVAAAFVALLVVAYLALGSRLLNPVEVPTVSARQGTLELTLRATGTVDAKRAVSITAPRVRNIQITWMAPEGVMVAAADPVIRFDSSVQEADVAEHRSTLQINQASLERQQQELAIQEKELTLALRQAQRKFDEQKHEAPKIAEESRLELELAELNARAKLEQIRADVQKAELEVARAKDKVALAQKELEQMTLNAPIPGMVVYLEIWKGNGMSKVQQGDSPWPGQGLINLPDLSEMIVNATVSEVDANQVAVDQDVTIALDAFPGVSFKGRVASKGTLARKKEPNSKINVFDVQIGILETDDRLKPGMSASCRVIVERIENVVILPIEAVFEAGGRPTVYLANRKPREVTVGRRSDTEIEVTSGVSPGESVCVVDPTIATEETTDERATQPELNRGRTSQGGEGGGGRQGGRSGS